MSPREQQRADAKTLLGFRARTTDTRQVGATVRRDVHEALAREAARKGESLSATVARILTEALTR